VQHDDLADGVRKSFHRRGESSSLLGSLDDDHGVADPAGERLAVLIERRRARLPRPMVDERPVGDRQKPTPGVPQAGAGPDIPPDAHGDFLEDVVGIVRIAAKPSERPQDDSAVIVQQILECLSLAVHATIAPGFVAPRTPIPTPDPPGMTASEP